MTKLSATVQLEERVAPPRVSVPVTNEMLEEIEVRARRAGVSRSTFLTRLVRYGLEAEQQKRDHFAQKIRQYRECADPNEVERLGNEIGEMMFGQ
jgi:metal-responsive CopG/Arc/MetJ family transcriptional regulator